MRRRIIGIVSIAAAAACESPPTMHTNAATVSTGTDVVVTFDEPLAGRAVDQFWVALQPVDAPASDTTGRRILERTDRVVRLHASTPGAFEVRLHGRYPKEDHHLLARIPVAVEGWPVKTGIEPKTTPWECLDRWLAARHFDEYGGAAGTIYAGGSPLVDEVTGKSASRWDYVVSLHPEVEQACSAPREPWR